MDVRDLPLAQQARTARLMAMRVCRTGQSRCVALEWKGKAARWWNTKRPLTRHPMQRKGASREGYPELLGHHCPATRCWQG